MQARHPLLSRASNIYIYPLGTDPSAAVAWALYIYTSVLYIPVRAVAWPKYAGGGGGGGLVPPEQVPGGNFS